MAAPQAESTSTAKHAPQRVGRRSIWIWVPVVFLAGLLVGGVIVAVFSEGTTVRPPGPTTTVTAPPPAGGGQQINFDAACVRAIRDAQGAYALLGRVADAVRSLDIGKLDGIVQQLAGLRHQLATDAADCHVGARLPSGPTPTQ